MIAWILGVVAYLVIAVGASYLLQRVSDDFADEDGQVAAGLFGLFWPAMLLVLPIIGAAKLLGRLTRQ